MPAVADLQVLLASIEPVLNPGTFVFAALPDGRTLEHGIIVASVREPEGVSVVVEERIANDEGLAATFRCAWITLAVNSDLQAVGLTAAFASALGAEGISCNVVAGMRHDHLFVPVDLAEKSMDALRSLQREAAAQSRSNGPG